MASAPTTNHEAEILDRLIKPTERTLSPAVARAILRLDFDPSDRDRMHELAARNQQQELTEPEQAELQSYLHIGLLLDLMHSKARRSLQRRAARR